MITLKEAVNITKIEDDEILYIRYDGESRFDSQSYTGKKLRDTFDMKNTKVIHILPRFMCGEYIGMEFILIK